MVGGGVVGVGMVGVFVVAVLVGRMMDGGKVWWITAIACLIRCDVK